MDVTGLIRAGRKPIEVDKDTLVHLKSLGFSWKEISDIMGPSPKTLCRRAAEWGLTTYSSITDLELDEKVAEIKQKFPNSGQVMINGHLMSQNVHVQRRRLRECIFRLNQSMHLPVNPRIYYSVPGPNYLWHIDGNHKIIRYNLVIHGGIDGFSRLITYLKCSNNNTARTVLEEFQEATRIYGTPSRVRSDKGGENVGVWDYMTDMRGDGRASYITGSSVHNTRIERLWRDMYSSVTSTFAIVFDTMEANEVLDPLNKVDIFCLHYVYVPRINQALTTFAHAWNSHPLSTESNHSPLQLYLRYSVGNPLFSDDLGYEEESDDTDSSSTTDASLFSQSSVHVHVPENNVSFSDSIMQALSSSVDPLRESSSYGADIYMQTVQVVYQLMLDSNILDN